MTDTDLGYNAGDNAEYKVIELTNYFGETWISLISAFLIIHGEAVLSKFYLIFVAKSWKLDGKISDSVSI